MSRRIRPCRPPCKMLVLVFISLPTCRDWGVGKTSNLPIQRLNPPARDIRALIPTLGEGEKRFIPLLMHAPAPIVLGLLRRLEASDVVLEYALHGLLDELGLELRAAGPVAEGRGCLGPVQEEHVRELRDGDAHAGAGAVAPVVGDGAAVDALDVQLRERARDAVEARGEDEHVDFDEAFVRAEPRLGDFEDGRFVHVDELDVRLVDHFVVPLLERRALRAPWMRRHLRSEDLLFLGILDPGEDVLAPEVVGFVVGFLVEEHVFVGCEPVSEAAFLDQELVVEFLPLLGAVLKGVLFGKIVGKAGEGMSRLLVHLLVKSGFLLFLFFLWVELALVHWQAHVGCSDVDGKFFGFVADLLRDLNA